MCETYLDEFKKEMAPAEKLYTAEIRKFAKKYSFLGEMELIEEPDIMTQDYIYSFKNLNGSNIDILRKTRSEIGSHMEEFSKENDIYEFFLNTYITFDRWF